MKSSHRTKLSGNKRKSHTGTDPLHLENLSLIQRNIQGSLGNLKRDCTSQEQSSITSCTEDCNLSPREKSSLSRKLFQEESINSNNNLPTLRPPLMNLDPNSINNSGGKKSRKSGVYSQEMMNCI